MTLLLDEPAVAVRTMGVVRVEGPDRLGYLHTLLSQHLEGAPAGTVADFLHLDAKGNALAAGRAVVRAADVLLVVPPDVAAGFADALDRYRFLLEVTVTDVSADWLLASVRGPAAVEVPGARPEPLTAVPHGDGLVVRDRSGGVDLLGPREWVSERVAGLGLPHASAADWESWRISAGEPAWGAEIVEGRRAQELGLLPTHVHLRKGCYPGQESIAKIYNLGRPRRALAVVAADAPPPPDVPLRAGDKTAEVTSASATGSGWVALALVPLDREGQAPDRLEGDGVEVRVRRLVGSDLPQPGAVPARPRA